MAITLTPEQEKDLVQALNTKVTVDKLKLKHGFSADKSDFKERSDTQLVRLAQKFLLSGKVKPALPAPTGEEPTLFDEKGISLVTPASVFDALNRILGPEKMARFVKGKISYEIKDSALPEAFLVEEITGELEREIDIYYFNLPASLKPFNLDAGMILEGLSPEDREKILSQLTFKHAWKKNNLYLLEKPKGRFLNYLFDVDRFMESALHRIEAEAKDFDEDKLIEKLSEIIDEIGRSESEYFNSEEYVMGGDNVYYAEENAQHASLKDIKNNVDDTIREYIIELENLDIDEDDIKQDLIESSDESFNDSYYESNNCIGRFGLGNEEEFDFSNHNEINEPTLPYPTSLSDNVALLSDEGASKLEGSVREMRLRLGYDHVNDCWRLGRSYLNISDNRSVELIVDEEKFISKAKRRIKDEKLKRREEVESSLRGNKFMKIEANEIAKKAESLPPMAKREMVAKLYEAIARSVLPMGEDRIRWMINFIYESMSDREVDMEWEFIQKGNVAKLVKLFKAMEDPEVRRKHADKIYDLQRLHQEIADGMEQTKEAGLEVDDSTFKFLEKTVMDFADDFIAELQGQKALPGDKKKLLSNYPTLSKFLGE